MRGNKKMAERGRRRPGEPLAVELSARMRRGYARVLPSDATRRIASPNSRFAGEIQGNFYIQPTEVLYFIEHTPILQNDYISLDQFSRMVQHALTVNYMPVVFYDKQRRISNPISFVENELAKMLSHTSDYMNSPYVEYEYINGDRIPELSIPSQTIQDLPVYLMLFILYFLSETTKPRTNYLVLYSFNESNLDMYHVIQNENNSNVVVKNRMLTLTALRNIYNTVIHNFAGLFDEDRGVQVRWQGSEGSGTRIMIQMWSSGNITLRMQVHEVSEQSLAGRWFLFIEELIMEALGNCVLSVRNKNDNKCLVYCIVLGLMQKFKNDLRVFGTDRIFVEDFEVYAKGIYLYVENDDQVSRLIRALCHCLFPPDYSPATPREFPAEMEGLIDFVDEIDTKVGTMMSLEEFKKTFECIEAAIIPKDLCGIDVYGIDYNVNPHVYPLYISKCRTKVIELICVTPTNSLSSHFCLITNRVKLFEKSGGKQFFSCSVCGKSYFHRRLLTEHQCTNLENERVFVDGEGGYHYSQKDNLPGRDHFPEMWYCTKCRLVFLSKFKYDYHREHCFMTGKTGYRHVQLITYESDKHPTLDGVEIDLEEEDQHVIDRRVLYADFESSINPVTGVHKFMSFGLYDWESDIYVNGETMEEFFEVLLQFVFNNDQTHYYVYFHNAMNYDANFILRYVLSTESCKNWGIKVIMKSSNRLQKLVFYVEQDKKKKQIHIGDTFLFLTLSLERIVGSIRKDNLEENQNNFERFFREFRRTYPWVSDEDIDHILRKNIFPYKFFDDASKLNYSISEFKKIFEPKPENTKYFSEKITVEDLQERYEDNMRVMDLFRCKYVRDYHNLYLMCDVMQLADVFSRSMDILWESHHIHLTKYIGMPSASWAAFLRFDPTMSIPLYEDTFYAEFFKGMVRGGITSAPLRHAVADENHSIIYLDVNGLYPYVMQAYDFPCGTFKFVEYNIVGKENCHEMLEKLFKHCKRTHTGICFCVDAVIPDKVKYITDMYPFMPEHRRIYDEYYEDSDTKKLTPFLERWSKANKDEKMMEFNGLVCTLYPKNQYNVHWRTLKWYMEHGVEITKVWFGVTFKEGNYLAGYVRKNIEIRNTRKDELGKTLYKLLGNSIYGKTFESPFKRNTYEIVRDPIKLQGMLDNSNIAAMQPIDEFGWVVKLDGEDIILDKPTYIGACVCEFSKLHMYTLLYDKLCKLFPGTKDEPGCQLVYTDTDSFIVKLRHPPGVTEDSETLFKYIKEHDPDLIGGIGGQVKSETGTDTIAEVIALRSKVYTYRTKDGHIGKRAKGTTGEAQELQLDFDTYKKALQTLVSVDTRNLQFVRKTFKISSIDVFRRSLSVNDGKRDICEDGIHTHAFGYPKDDDED